MSSFMVPATGGTAAVLTGVLVSGRGSGFSSELALTIVSCVGNGLACFLMVLPVITFLLPIIKENTVGERTAHGHVLTLLGSGAWGLYAVITWKQSAISTVINAAGFMFQLVYVGAFIYYAIGKTRWIAVGILLLALVKTGILTWMVVEKIIRRGEWHKRTIGTFASVISGVGYTRVVLDIRAVAISKDVSNMDPPLQVLFTMLKAATSVYFAYMSTPVDHYIGMPNVLGVGLLLTQLVMYVIHRKAKPGDEETARTGNQREEETTSQTVTKPEEVVTREETNNASTGSPDFGLVELFTIASPHADVPADASSECEIEVVV